MNEPTLVSLSNSLAAAVEAAAPAVVRVQSGRRVASGLVWGEGLVVTVARAVSRRQAPTIGLHDGSSHPAVIVGRDPSLDLALLSVEGLAASAAERSQEPPKVGHIVLALGRPGAGPRASMGLVSAVGGAWTTPDGGRLDAFWDVDGALPPGFSGGPLLDARGAVLGVNTTALVRGGTTIPWPTVERAARELREHGDRSPGFLGVLFQPTRLSEEHAVLAGQPGALLITGLKPKGPAEGAGLQVGDLLLSVDGRPIGGWEDLAQALAGRAGEGAAVVVLRGGAKEERSVQVGQRTRGERC